MQFIQSLKLAGLLSFPPDMESFKLESLNVLIGPNGSGKSNFIQAFELLRALPTDFAAAASRAGGVRELIWKGERQALFRGAEIGLTTRRPPRGLLAKPPAIDYLVEFDSVRDRPRIIREIISKSGSTEDGDDLVFYYPDRRSGFPALSEEVGPLLGTHRRFVAALDLVGVEGFLGMPGRGPGRPPEDRRALARAFLAKAVWDVATTRHLIDRLGADPALRRLCGWSRLGDIPSEATFSRAFAAFSASRLAQRMHEALVVDVLGEALIGHVSRNSTAIEGREAAVAKPKIEVPKRRPGRPRRGEERPKAPSRLERQADGMSLDAMLDDLPKLCDRGTKRNARSMLETWRDKALKQARNREARAQRAAGHPDARTVRYRIRTTVERTNARLKDECGARHVRVRGPTKVACHLMFGLLALTADQMIRLVAP